MKKSTGAAALCRFFILVLFGLFFMLNFVLCRYMVIYVDVLSLLLSITMEKKKATLNNLSSEDTVWKRFVSWIRTFFFISILLSFLITFLFWCLGQSIVLTAVFNFYCEDALEGNVGEELVYTALNLNHSIRENKNNKGRLLSMFDENVKWYSSRKKKKEHLSFGSQYDCFCFSTPPKYDDNDNIGNNYEVRINGFHRYRKPENELVKLESLYAEIQGGKITSLYTIPLNQFEGQSPAILNNLYSYFFGVVFCILGILIFLIAMVAFILKEIPWLVSGMKTIYNSIFK